MFAVALQIFVFILHQLFVLSFQFLLLDKICFFGQFAEILVPRGQHPNDIKVTESNVAHVSRKERYAHSSAVSVFHNSCLNSY